MLIYKIQENGKATDFQHAKKCPEGWKSVEGDVIPEDKTPYHEKGYIDSQALESQKSTCIQYLKETDYMLLDDFEYQADVPAIKVIRLEWKRIIKSDQIEEVPEKPF